MNESDQVEKSLKSLRGRIERLAEQVEDDRADRGRAQAVTGLAAALLALTAATWFTERTRSTTSDYSLWGLVDKLGGAAFVVLALMVLLAVGSIVVAAAPVLNRQASWALLALSVAAAPCVGWLNSTLPDDGKDLSSAGWVSLIIAIALACLHGARLRGA
ncbi:hypothetical protein [Actinokineospora sp.]|uniref:hypothetical protein n=1 Tax=Actinokineospora sp. TaxID=1872133 RepID=UPI004037C75D